MHFSPLMHSESKWHLPPGEFEHFPLLHLAPPPQSESKLHLPSGPGAAPADVTKPTDRKPASRSALIIDIGGVSLWGLDRTRPDLTVAGAPLSRESARLANRR